MKRARTASRQPSAGPSKRVKPLPRPGFAEGVIELSDSDDERYGKSPARKRQRTARVSAETIDLTLLSSPVLPSRKSSFDAKDVKPQSCEKGKEKAFADVTNEQNILGRQPSSAPALDAPPVIVQEAPEPINPSMDPLDNYLAQVLEVVPDVQSDHARSLLLEHLPIYGTDVVATVLHLLFEQPYPKIERNKGKRKREDGDASDDSQNSTTKNYGSKDREFEGGEHYYNIAMNQLTIDFPHVPVPHVRKTLQANNCLYAPTHLMLREQMKQVPMPFILKVFRTKSSSKGKYHDAEFDREFAWLMRTSMGDANKTDDPVRQEDDDDGECEDGIECGCCFSTYAFDKMVQCPDAHLFCKGCMRSFVENQLGQHDPNITCMDQSGCKLAFADAELRRILSTKLLDLYERVKQAKEIEAAELDGLEECPFCEYKVVIENPEEKLFRCEREECGAVSCRACKKLDHVPKSCKEAEEDKGLNARHRVEEAMTEALMRNCPKCKKPFIKESGCNKMSCPNCRTLSCYICRQVITGYDHFDPGQGQNYGRGSSSKRKCLLWDPVEQHHDRDVAAAREKAIKEVEAENPEVDTKQLEVELPKTTTGANNARAGQARLGGLQLHNVLGLRGVVPEGWPGARELPPMQHPPPLLPYPGYGPQPQQDMLPRFGIKLDFQFDPFLPGMGLLFQQRPERLPRVSAAEVQEELRRRQAARREETQQRNEEARRRAAERQEEVRREYEAWRQEIDAKRRRVQHRREDVLMRHPLEQLQLANEHMHAMETASRRDQQPLPLVMPQETVHPPAPAFPPQPQYNAQVVFGMPRPIPIQAFQAHAAHQPAPPPYPQLQGFGNVAGPTPGVQPGAPAFQFTPMPGAPILQPRALPVKPEPAPGA